MNGQINNKNIINNYIGGPICLKNSTAIHHHLKKRMKIIIISKMNNFHNTKEKLNHKCNINNINLNRQMDYLLKMIINHLK